MTEPSLSRTVRSQLTTSDSSCFIRHLWRYPERLVLTAVSIRPSRPDIQWKKKSWGRNPEMNLSDTKPQLRGFGSYGKKHGRVLPFYYLGTRRPSSTYYPRIADIIVQLTTPPFAPVNTMADILFFGNFFTRPSGIQSQSTADQA